MLLNFWFISLIVCVSRSILCTHSNRSFHNALGRYSLWRSSWKVASGIEQTIFGEYRKKKEWKFFFPHLAKWITIVHLFLN